MAYEDLPLDRGMKSPSPPPRSAPPPPPRPSSSARWIIVAAAVVVVGGVLYWWWLTRAQPRPAAPAPSSTEVAIGQPRPSRQPLDLPPLNASDAFVRQAFETLSKHPLLARLFATDLLIRNTVLAVEQIGEGKTPSIPLKVLQPATRLTIVGTDSGGVDPRSYQRWESATSALTSIRPADAAQLYVNFKPLFDEAYGELGHPGGDFDESVARAISVLRATPNLTTEPMLLKRPSYFEHADASLRSLRPVQKQLLLTGAARRTRILQWLTALASALDLKVD
jgi:hypothetical protein